VRLRVFKIIELYDGRYPFGLVDPSEDVIRVDAKQEWLADYAFDELCADRVIDAEGETMRESDRARRSDSRFGE
jgi:hypothetical protein